MSKDQMLRVPGEINQGHCPETPAVVMPSLLDAQLESQGGNMLLSTKYLDEVKKEGCPVSWDDWYLCNFEVFLNKKQKFAVPYANTNAF